MQQIKKCPKCGGKIKDFIVDFEKDLLFCNFCHATFKPEQIFTNKTVNSRAFLIPTEFRDVYLSKLGFERQPIRRTPTIVLWILIIITIFGMVTNVFLNWGKITSVLCIIFGGIAFIFTILGYYKAEEKPKWKKIKA